LATSFDFLYILNHALRLHSGTTFNQDVSGLKINLSGALPVLLFAVCTKLFPQ